MNILCWRGFFWPSTTTIESNSLGSDWLHLCAVTGLFFLPGSVSIVESGAACKIFSCLHTDLRNKQENTTVICYPYIGPIKLNDFHSSRVPCVLRALSWLARLLNANLSHALASGVCKECMHRQHVTCKKSNKNGDRGWFWQYTCCKCLGFSEMNEGSESVAAWSDASISSLFLKTGTERATSSLAQYHARNRGDSRATESGRIFPGRSGCR